MLGETGEPALTRPVRNGDEVMALGRIKIGAWIHKHDDLPLETQIQTAAEYGLEAIRSYTIGYSEAVGPPSWARAASSAAP